MKLPKDSDNSQQKVQTTKRNEKKKQSKESTNVNSINYEKIEEENNKIKEFFVERLKKVEKENCKLNFEKEELNSKIQNLENEIKLQSETYLQMEQKLNEELEKKNKEMEDLKKELENELKLQSEKYLKMEERYKEEMEKLNEELEKKKKEMEELKEEMENEIKLQSQNYLEMEEKYKVEMEKKNKEMENLKTKMEFELKLQSENNLKMEKKLNEELEKRNKEVEDLKEKLNKLQNSKEDLMKLNKEIENKYIQSQSEMLAMKKLFSEKACPFEEKKLEKMNHELDKNAQKINEMKEDFNFTFNLLMNNIDKLRKDKLFLEKKLNENKNISFQQQVNYEKSRLELIKTQKELCESKKELDFLKKEICEKKYEKSKLKFDFIELENKFKFTNEILTMTSNDNELLKKEVENLRTLINELTLEKSIIKKENEILKTSLKDFQKKFIENDFEKEKLQIELDQLCSKLGDTQKLLNELKYHLDEQNLVFPNKAFLDWEELKIKKLNSVSRLPKFRKSLYKIPNDTKFGTPKSYREISSPKSLPSTPKSLPSTPKTVPKRNRKFKQSKNTKDYKYGEIYSPNTVLRSVYNYSGQLVGYMTVDDDLNKSFPL